MLHVITLEGNLAVEDTDGGIWYPSEDAYSRAVATSNPEAELLRLCETQPMLGTWRN